MNNTSFYYQNNSSTFIKFDVQNQKKELKIKTVRINNNLGFNRPVLLSLRFFVLCALKLKTNARIFEKKCYGRSKKKIIQQNDHPIHMVHS